MSDTPSTNPQGDEGDDPLAELESIVVRSAQRFEPSTADDAELAYYLETKPRSGGHSAPAKPAAPVRKKRNDPHNKDFLGSSEDQFEAAFRSLEKQTSSAPMRKGSVFEKEPVFEEPPPQDYSRTFPQTFEEEMTGSSDTSGQESETRAGAFDFDTRFVTRIAVTVFVAVVGALIYSCVGVKNTGEPIGLKTDTSPVKKMAATETEQPSSNEATYERLSSTGDSNNEKIVSQEERPVDNLQAPDASSAAVPAAPASPPQASSTTPRVASPVISQPSPSETNEEPPESPPSAAAAEDVATPAVPTATRPKPVTEPQAQPLRRANVTSTTPSTVPSSDVGFVVQVSSQKSQDSARAAFSSLQARFPRMLKGYQPSIKAVTLVGRGTHYRVRVGPLAGRDEASALCGRLKAAGGDCLVVQTSLARNEPTDRGGRLRQRPVSPSEARLGESRPSGPR